MLILPQWRYQSITHKMMLSVNTSESYAMDFKRSKKLLGLPTECTWSSSYETLIALGCFLPCFYWRLKWQLWSFLVVDGASKSLEKEPVASCLVAVKLSWYVGSIPPRIVFQRCWMVCIPSGKLTWKMQPLKMHSPLNMGIFNCQVSLQECDMNNNACLAGFG